MSDSTILVKSPDGWKIKVAFGIFSLAVIVILAFLYRVSFTRFVDQPAPEIPSTEGGE